MKSIWAPIIIALQTFDFDRPGELTSLERNACISYYNQQHPDRVSSATEHEPLLLLLYVVSSLHKGLGAKHYFVASRTLHSRCMTSACFARLVVTWSADPQLSVSAMLRPFSRHVTWQCSGCILQTNP